jgi:GNAT superfamily N-acetyltransferase
MVGVEERTPLDVSLGPLLEADLAEADRIFHMAFGTFLGLPDPMQFWPDRNYARTRWKVDPTAAFGAKVGDRLIATNFAIRWGSVGFFGPLTVHPDFWDRGIANRLLKPTMELFAHWGTKHAGLFTFAPQCQACSSLPEIRVLASLSHRGNDEENRVTPASANDVEVLGANE